jgi:hypothetical protein
MKTVDNIKRTTTIIIPSHHNQDLDVITPELNQKPIQKRKTPGLKVDIINMID